MITILTIKSMGRRLGRRARAGYPRSPMSANRLLDLFHRLRGAYGPQDWWPADGPLEVVVGAILTQRTAWRNVERAMEGLRECDLLSVEAIGGAPVERVADSIRPAGFYNVKAKKLKTFVACLIERHNGDLSRLFSLATDDLREELLGLFGIGEETADAILVYAAGRTGFVIDAYARRLLARLGWIDGGERYRDLRDLFLSALPSDVDLLGEFHALIVRHGKTHCRSSPICDGCPIRSACAAGGVVGEREANR
jgi:endonuclease-3 related protein